MLLLVSVLFHLSRS